MKERLVLLSPVAVAVMTYAVWPSAVNRARAVTNWLKPNIPSAELKTVGSSAGRVTRQSSCPSWALAERIKPA